MILEVCVDSVASAMAAQKGGATRLELCANLIIGGTTPSLALFEEVKKQVTIPIHVLIRPRFGDFCYDQYEYEIIKKEVMLFRDAGAAAVVIGCLSPDGQLDQEKMKELVQLARPAKVTLHRAFDVCRDPLEAYMVCEKLGIDTILTSGQEQSSQKGMKLISDLQKKANQRQNGIEIMAGAGIHAGVIAEFLKQTEITSFHMSGKVVMDSVMTYRKEGVSMGLPGFSEFELWQTSEELVEAAAKQLGLK